MSSKFQEYTFGPLGEELAMPEVTQHAGKLVVPPYENDVYAGMFAPAHGDVVDRLADPLFRTIRTAQDVVGHRRLTILNKQSVSGDLHDDYLPDATRLNRNGLPQLTVRTDFTLQAHDSLRDPEYPPRLNLILYLSDALMRPMALQADDTSSGSRAKTLADARREEQARLRLVQQPVGTARYQEFSQDVSDNPTPLYAAGLFMADMTVYTWGEESAPDYVLLRKSKFNAIPRQVKLFHSVRFDIETDS